jgi:hypothetical protein
VRRSTWDLRASTVAGGRRAVGRVLDLDLDRWTWTADRWSTLVAGSDVHVVEWTCERRQKAAFSK